MDRSSTQAAEVSTSAPLVAYSRLKRRVHEVLDVAPPGDPLARAFQIFLPSLILANVLAMVVGTVPRIAASHGVALATFEAASVLVFSAEYLLRLWCADLSPAYPGSVRGRARYALSPMALVDLAAIVPFWLTAVGIDLRVLRVIRMMRVFRIAKLARYTSAVQTLGRVLVAKKEELTVLLAMIVMLLLCASTLMYFAEVEAQPEVFSSVPAAMWWAVATVSTVGYGDIYPVTAMGKALASIVALLGIALFALPTGILGAEFVNELSRKSVRCSHCGEEIRGGPSHPA